MADIMSKEFDYYQNIAIITSAIILNMWVANFSIHQTTCVFKLYSINEQICQREIDIHTIAKCIM